MISGTSNFFTKSGPLHFFVYVEMLQTIHDKYGIIFKTYYFSISHHFGTPEFPDLLALPGIKHVEFIFNVSWWIFAISWESENFKSEMFERPEVWIHKHRPTKSRIFLKHIDFLMNNLENLIPPNRSGFPRFFGKQRTFTMVES